MRCKLDNNEFGLVYSKLDENENDKNRLTEEFAKQYLKNLSSKKFNTFDDMLSFVEEFHVILIKRNEWTLSQCTCKIWQKKYKCDHSIGTCARLELTNFDEIAMNFPLTKKARRGRKPGRQPALVRDDPIIQNHEHVSSSSGSETDSDDENEEVDDENEEVDDENEEVDDKTDDENEEEKKRKSKQEKNSKTTRKSPRINKKN
jgi:hypothetical protein